MDFEWEPLEENIPFLELKQIPYSELSGIINMLFENSKSSIETVKELYTSGQYKDPRLYPFYVSGVGDVITEISSYIAETIIPSVGEEMIPYLKENLNLDGTNADGRRLIILNNLAKSRMIDLSLKALEGESASPVYLAAIKTLRNEPQYESILLELTKAKKKQVRQEAFYSLAYMDSKTGNELILKQLQTSKTGDIIEALKSTQNVLIIQKIHDEVRR